MNPFRNTLRDYLYIVFKHKSVLFAITLGIIILTLVYSMLKTPMYRASTQIYVRSTIYNESLFDNQRDIIADAMPFGQERINTEIAIVTSWPVMEKVVSLFQLQSRKKEDKTIRDYVKYYIKWPISQLFSLPGLIRELISGSEDSQDELGASGGGGEAVKFRKTVNGLQGKIKCKPVPFSRVFMISYQDYDPQMAAKIVNAVTDEYLNRHLEVNINIGKSGFYAEQINALTQKLDVLEDQFSRFRSDEKILSYDEQEKSLLFTMNSYNNALTEVRKEIISQQNKLERIKNYMRDNPDQMIPSKELAQDPLISQLNRELVQLQLKLADLKQKYTDENRLVTETEAQIEDYNKQIREQVIKRIELETASLEKLIAEESALESTIAELRATMSGLPKKEITYKSMEENLQREKELLKNLKKKYEEALVEEASDSRSRMVKVIEYANVPSKPSSPNIRLNLIIAILIAPLIGLGTVLGLEFFDHSINNPEDSEHYLGLKTLGSIKEV